MTPSRGRALRSPLTLALLVALAVFVADTLGHVAIHLLMPQAPVWVEILLDAALLLALVSPVLFALVFQPLVARMAALERAEAELRTAQDALAERARASDEALAAVIEASPVAIVVHTPDGRVKLWNHAAEDTFGWTAAEVAGRLHPIVPQDRKEEFQALFARTAGGERLMGVDIRRQRKDGEILDLSLWTAPLHGPAGEVTAVIALLLDVTQGKRAERRLHLQAAALAAAANAVLISDREGRIVWTNDAFSKLTGWSRDECRGKTPRILKSGRHPRQLYEEMWRTILGGNVWRQEMVNRRKNGELYVEDQTITPVKDERGEIAHFVAIKIDVSERKQADKALRESEERYRLLFQGMLNGLAYCKMLYDDQGRPEDFVYLAVNPAFESLTGLKDVVGKRVSDVIPGIREADPELFEIYGGVARTGIPKTFETYVAALRMWFWISVYSSEPGHFVAVFDVITERKRAEEALRESESRYRALFHGNLAAVYRSTEDGRVLECNDAFARILGYASRQDVLGVRADALYPTASAREPLLEELRAAGIVVNYESEMRRSDGRPLWILENAHFAPGERPGDPGIIEGTFVDITARRHLEEQLRQSQKLQGVGRLAGGVAHDFNNILGVIVGYGELARRQLGADHPARPRVDQMLKAAERAAGLTRQLLAFSRKQILQPKLIDLNALIADAEKMLGRLIGEDIDVVVRVAPGLGMVRADPSQVEQIIMNLAVNARDAMPQGGTLTFETGNVELDDVYAATHTPALPGHYVLLSVSDTGVGMDKETQAQIFEPFFTTKAAGEGTGLGLATVYGIVKQSGGYIWLYSEPGRGTTFKVYLPRVDEPIDAAGLAAASTHAPGGHETILLVEDMTALREVVREALEERGYTVLLASNGEEALTIALDRDPIHLLLTDVVLPKLGGGELAKRLAVLRPGLRVLYMSGYPDGMISRQGILQDGVVLLEKPFTAAKLARAVREALDRPVAT